MFDVSVVVPPVRQFEVSKGDVADGHIKKAVWHLHRFKSIDGNAGILIELLGNSAADAVNLHAIGFAARHISRKQTDKIAGAAGRFYVPTDFDTIEKAFSGAKAAEKGLK